MIEKYNLCISYAIWKQEVECFADLLNKDYGYNIMVLDDKQDLGEGSTVMDFSEPVSAYVGIRVSDSVRRGKYMSDYMYTQGIVAMYHEAHHINQQLYPISSDTVMSYVLSNYESQYTFPSMNYWNMPHEIDAEYQGILDAHDHLINKFNQEQADTAILDYVNERAHGNYFVHKYAWQKFKSLDEVTDAFIAADENAVKNLRAYDFSIDGSIKRSGIDKSILKKYLNTKTKEEHVLHLVAIENYLYPGLISEGVNDPEIKKELQKKQF